MLKRTSKLAGIICLIFAIMISGVGNVQIVFAKTNTCTVRFVANGGSGSMSSQTITYGKNEKLSGCTFIRKGYSFQGWAKSKNGKVAYKNKENADNVAKTGKNVKLYAKWKKQGKRRALILGETSTTAVPMLDVTSMKKMMKNCKFYGKKMDSIITYPNHTKKEITNKIKKTFKNNKSNDVSYIYMTCHGKENGRVCIGSDDTSYSVKELRKLFDKNIEGKVVFLLDCCYAENVITKKNISVVTKQDSSTSDSNTDDTSTDENSDDENLAEKFVQDFISYEEDNENMKKGSNLATSKYVILCSSRVKEYSLGGDCSLATKYWELGSGWNPISDKKCGLKADKNKNKKITISELYKYSYAKVLANNEEQHVVLHSKNKNFIIFGRFDR